MRLTSLCLAPWLTLCLAVMPAAARDTTIGLGEGHAAALLHLPAALHHRPPVVLMLADGPAPDMRSDRHIEHLLGAGIAVVEPQGPTPDLAAILQSLVHRPEVDAGRIGLLARGRGARIDLPGSPILASVLLYPGCASPPPRPAPGAVLLMHGDADPANPPAACAQLAEAWRGQGLEVAHHVIRGAGYAWDIRPVGPASAEMLPRPDGPGRLRAEAWPAAAEFAAHRAARFLAAELDRGS